MKLRAQALRGQTTENDGLSHGTASHLQGPVTPAGGLL
jgi:hypothetical protein